MSGVDGDGAPTAQGTFIGSSNIEGFQAQMFIGEVDDRAEDWLMHLSTSDGVTLSGFATLADALAYDYGAPLRWFPAKIAVTETDDGTAFLKPSYALGDSSSDLLDLAGVLLGYSTFYALTDTANRDVGGSQPARVVFDGDPFPADNQKADGEATLHDRALAMLRVAVVDLDRMHADPQSGVLVDSVTITGQGATAQRGTTVSTTSRGVRDPRAPNDAPRDELAARALLEQHARHRDRVHAARRAPAEPPVERPRSRSARRRSSRRKAMSSTTTSRTRPGARTRGGTSRRPRRWIKPTRSTRTPRRSAASSRCTSRRGT